MTVNFRGVGVCVLGVVAAYVTAAVGPRRPDHDYEYKGGKGSGDGEGVAECGVALLHELHTLTDLVQSIKHHGNLLPPPSPPVVQDCSTLRQEGVKGSGVYRVFPFTFSVYCDMVTDGGGWTVIQRRLPQKVQENFSRGWSSYKKGFGQLDGEMWLGLDAMYQLTHSAHYELRVDMVDYEQGPKYASYKMFRVGSPADGYRLFVANYSGNAGDALSHFHSGRRFSTLDRDQDLARNKSCAEDKEGGWWFHACYSAHPNGRFPTTLTRFTDGKEIRWWTSNDHVLVLTHFVMKIRRRSHEDAELVTPDHENDYNPDQSDLFSEDNYESSLENSRENSTDDSPWQEDDERDSKDKNFDYPGHEGRSDIPPGGQKAMN